MASLDAKFCTHLVPWLKKMKPWLLKRYEARTEWVRNHLVFTKPIFFVWGLILSHSIVEYATLCILMLYLRDTMGKSLRSSAIIINAFDGLSSVLVFVVAYIAEAYTDRFNVLVFSTGSYTVGLILLWISCLSTAESSMLYVAIVLLALGKSGRGSTLPSFLEYQLRKGKDNVANTSIEEERQTDIRLTIWWYSAWIVGYVIPFWPLTGNTTWLAIFKISALVMGGTCLIFYSGLCCYDYENPTRKSLRHIFRILTSNKFHFWATFFPMGLVVANGNTLFLAEVTVMNYHIGSYIVSPSFFFVLKSFTSDIVVFLFWWTRATGRSMTLKRIGAGIICAVFCCFAARQLELRKQHVFSVEPIKNPGKVVSMSVLWLIPQYFLLGLMEGLTVGGLVTSFYGHVPKSMRSFAVPFSELVLCIGKFSSIIFVLIFATSTGNDQSYYWNYLDRYFLMLSILCSVFFCLYLCWSLDSANMETNSGIGELETTEAALENSQGTQEASHGVHAEEEAPPQDMETVVEIVQTMLEEAKEDGNEES